MVRSEDEERIVDEFPMLIASGVKQDCVVLEAESQDKYSKPMISDPVAPQNRREERRNGGLRTDYRPTVHDPVFGVEEGSATSNRNPDSVPTKGQVRQHGRCGR
jgi:hypothetical protein